MFKFGIVRFHALNEQNLKYEDGTVGIAPF